MSSIAKAKYYRFNGTEWVQFLFETSADLIIETQNYKVMTANERQKISTYLNSFNSANKLLQLNDKGKINVELIPDLTDYGYIKHGDAVSFSSVGVDTSVVTEDLFVNEAAAIRKLKPRSSAFTSISVEGNLEMNGSSRILNLPSPQNNNEAATKGYVDSLVAVGTRPVESVKVATTENINPYGEITVDGYIVRTGDRVLVWKQTNKSENGIYVVNTTSWTKVYSDSTQGSYVFVENGNTHNDWYFFCQDQNGTWIAHGRPDTIQAGSGLTKIGTTISISDGAITNSMLAGNISHTKIASFGVLSDVVPWDDITDATNNKTIQTHLQHIYAVITRLRGTYKYNESNNQSIAGAYEAISKRNRTYTGTSLPGTGGYATGDLFFLELVSS